MPNQDRDADGVRDGVERWILIVVGLVLVSVSIYFMFIENPYASMSLYPGIGCLIGEKALGAFFKNGGGNY